MPETMPKELPVIWLQGAGCTGCSVSVLNSVSPSIKNVIVDEVVPGTHINVRFHPNIMAGSGDAIIKVLDDTQEQDKGGYVLVIEGAVPIAKDGKYCTVGEENGKAVPMVSRVKSLSANAVAVVALGTCASYGGISAASPNPANCRSVSEVLKTEGIATPVVNIPGCAPHPDWFVGTVASILLFGLPTAGDVDENGRPKAFYNSLIHDNCQRRAYYDENKFAKKLGDPGCLYELGCKGPVTYADCATRLWNNGANWCVGSGSPCLGCVEPGFPDMVSPMYEKIVEV
ncbi:MAG: hydrogenase small subunit [Chloroflexi bacterium]|jgi:hydrogenase small subunit|nr:hydrogenase small subunit [Chloroflexota bacterium]MBT7082585.1 hydrogenase small subunit [Chloroflexota bacterium]MBT7289130.1 hydrogenase small subunit [Chloroflexota bacterium]